MTQRFWLGVTDKGWYDYLRSQPVEDVNFWQPRGGRRFGAIAEGELFLFKLHYPYKAVVGGGFFVRHTSLPAFLAWESFAEANGAGTRAEFFARIQRYVGGPVGPSHEIGCNILCEPFFLDEKDWIEPPDDWAPNIVQGKTYSTDSEEGARIYREVVQHIRLRRPTQVEDRYGEPILVKPRLGQGAFRVIVTDAYHRRCALTGERTLPALEAAHIKPYAESGPHALDNGLLLRSDLHRLFDLGYLTVTSEYRVEVSKRIKEEYENGREYYKLHGESLPNLPDRPLDRPDSGYLRWHNEERFRN